MSLEVRGTEGSFVFLKLDVLVFTPNQVSLLSSTQSPWI